MTTRELALRMQIEHLQALCDKALTVLAEYSMNVHGQWTLADESLYLDILNTLKAYDAAKKGEADGHR